MQNQSRRPEQAARAPPREAGRLSDLRLRDCCVTQPLHPVISALLACAGRYRGEGVNHDGDPFEGAMVLRELPGGRTVGVVSSALGRDGTVYHSEESVIAPGADGVPVLQVISTNQPDGVRLRFHRETRSDDHVTLTFRVGDPAAMDSFREEVHFDLWSNDDVTHRYSWGLPGGEFADRSGSRMRRER